MNNLSENEMQIKELVSKKVLIYTQIINSVEKKSLYIWDLIQKQNTEELKSGFIPKVIIQYWDDKENIPDEVFICMKSWMELKDSGIKYLLFNDTTAKEFISKNYDERYLQAYNNCMHPAIKSDYFRLCYIYLNGGAYIDVDDICAVTDKEQLFTGTSLKLQALCYDLNANNMISATKAFYKEYQDGRIYYVNNNPLISPPNNELIYRALITATKNLLNSTKLKTMDVQAIAGPGNLVNSIIWNSLLNDSIKSKFYIYTNWDDIALTKWQLGYRNDQRNWRNWDRDKT